MQFISGYTVYCDSFLKQVTHRFIIFILLIQKNKHLENFIITFLIFKTIQYQQQVISTIWSVGAGILLHVPTYHQAHKEDKDWNMPNF